MTEERIKRSLLLMSKEDYKKNKKKKDIFVVEVFKYMGDNEESG